MPAPGWKKKTKSPSGVGLTLVNIRKAAHKAYENAENKASEDVLESVLEVRDLDEVMEQAELAGRLFAANNPLPDLLIHSEINVDSLSHAEKNYRRIVEEDLHRSSLTVPRRPKWTPGMTAEVLDVEERKAFLNWRRGLARLEANENLVVTPFEKNLDIWRQLWRVLERSELIVVVVDARNPLFYRCPDLEAYVRELGQNKQVMLLLNKADLLTSSSRQEWATHFKSQGVSFLFWSAKAASALLEDKSGSSEDVFLRQDEDIDIKDDLHILGREELLHRLQKEAESIVKLQKDVSNAALSKHVPIQDIEVLIGSETGSGETQVKGVTETQRRVVIGFVGYPNVGKSSTINALVGEKKTGVTSTPGKTKHFQTLIISEQMMLCDCPGLVFPSFTTSKSEMVASGVLPIDKLTDHRGPIQVVANNVPRDAFKVVYGISLPSPKLHESQARPPSAAELLFVFAVSRGYFANGGLPDETRAARLILKDYVSGKLPYCHSPPGHPTTDDRGAQAASVLLKEDPAGLSDEEEGERETGQEDLSNEEETEREMGPEDEASTSAMDRISLEESPLMQFRAALPTKDIHTVEEMSADKLARVFDDFDSGIKVDHKYETSKSQRASNAPHKMHKKAARKKDRSWRAGGKQSVMTDVVNAVKIPVSHGAADRYQVQIFE